jgi:polysaccharide deacetylase family protein (PEP-CTERM system associated)
MSRQEFREDALTSRLLLEDISGQRVIGFRAPGFSATREVAWFFQELEAVGYGYDSSVFPAARQHGGWAEANFLPHVAPGTESLMEFPITTVKVLGKRLCVFGGGYLRLFPWWFVSRMTRKVLGEGRPVVFYVHPREIDPEQPRLPMSPVRKFKTYINLSSTAGKIERLVSEFEMATFRELLAHAVVNPARTVAALPH